MDEPAQTPDLRSAQDARLEGLIRDLRRDALDEAGRRDLLEEHQRCFAQRLRVLDRGFFPGHEKSEAAIASLGHGAFVSFDREPIYDGAPAFENVVVRALPPRGYLYRWRTSATMQFLKREGPERLKARFRLRRGVQIHLREGFEVVGTWAGERLWAPLDAALPARDGPVEVDALQPSLDGKRGKEAVRAIIEAAGAPLTKSEVALVLTRVHGTLPEVEVSEDAAAPLGAPDAGFLAVEAARAEAALAPRVARFYASLDDKQRRLLHARGWAEERPTRSFEEAARVHGGWSAESCRQHERRILDRLARCFSDRDELAIAAKILVAQLRLDTRGEEAAS